MHEIFAWHNGGTTTLQLEFHECARERERERERERGDIEKSRVNAACYLNLTFAYACMYVLLGVSDFSLSDASVLRLDVGFY